MAFFRKAILDPGLEIKINPHDDKKEAKKYKGQHPLLPQFSPEGSRVEIIGPSGSGKTCVLISILENSLFLFDRLFIYGNTVLNQVKYDRLRKNLAKKRMFSDPKCNVNFDMSSNPDDIISPEVLDENERNVVVFDDILNWPQDGINQIFTEGRHKNVMVFILSQSYYRLSKLIRLNSNMFFLFQLPSMRELTSIAYEHALDKDRPEIVAMYREAMSERPHNFFIIDQRDGIMPEMKYRSGFDGLLQR